MQENFESWGRLDEFMGYFLYDPSNRATQVWSLLVCQYIYTLGLDLLYSLSLSWEEGLPTIFPDFTGSSVNPSLWLVLGQSYATVRKLTLLPLSYGHVCGTLASWSVQISAVFCIARDIRNISSLCLSSARCLSFPPYCHLVLYLWALSSLGELSSLSIETV